jgi:anti-sigma regulatory factor (Ser/Thr protein kinase)
MSISPRANGAGPGEAAPADGYAFQLTGGPEACMAARRTVAASAGRLPAAVRHDVLLLVTELVANAVRHAGVGPDQSLRIEVRQWPRRLRVGVVDPGGHFHQVRPRKDTDGPGGLGLVLVERIAARWGVGHGAPGTRVWFEIEFER